MVLISDLHWLADPALHAEEILTTGHVKITFLLAQSQDESTQHKIK